MAHRGYPLLVGATFDRRAILPDIGPLAPCRRGTICKLADRPWPLGALPARSARLPLALNLSVVALSLLPIDIIDTERL